jgi:hypothetical protein
MNDLITANEAMKILIKYGLIEKMHNKVVAKFRFDDPAEIECDGIVKHINNNNHSPRVTLLALRGLLGINLERCRELKLTLIAGEVAYFEVDFIATKKGVSLLSDMVGEICQ